MIFQEDIPLSTLTTMRLGGLARYVVEITTTDDLVAAVTFAQEHNLPWFVLGGGSNVVALGDYHGLIILNRIEGFEKLAEDPDTPDTATYRIGAGQVWEQAVEQLVDLGLSGVEAMGGIPGYAGSTPIQNVGAYGQEIANTLQSLEAYDTSTNSFVTLSAPDCRFAYRDSLFKNPATRHHIITSITLRLSKHPMQPPFYPSLERYLANQGVTDFTDLTPDRIHQAVLTIRDEKLPDPSEIPSAGSFFKNPIMEQPLVQELLSRFPNMPHWDQPNHKVKLAAGWLIEQAGLKGYASHGLQIYPDNALIVTNLSATSGNDLTAFKSEVITKVQEMFGITLQQEPENL